MDRAAIQAEIAQKMVEFYDDPLGYVMWAFPWGKPGTVLEKYTGPRPWQREFLEEWGRKIKASKFNGIDPVAPVQMGVVSGHGVGKSAQTAWVIKFIMDTRPYAKGVVTANTSSQLTTKTWSELGKWHNMSVTQHLFNYRNSRGNMSLTQIEDPEIWRCDGLTCREENSESFAGQHSATSTSFYIFDEASAVPEKIFEVAQGGLTDGEPMIFCFGNPTRNTGFFRNIFGRNKHRWHTMHLDSRDVEGTNHELFQQWIEDYGEDSDFVRVRVRGMFPRASSCQFIPDDIVAMARGKHLRPDQYSFAPVVLGVDCGYYGDDESTIWLRQGLMSRRLWSGREVEQTQVAGMTSEFMTEFNAVAVFVDAGMGNGVIGRLRELGRSPMPVWFGSKSNDPTYFNKRAEMWGKMKEWLKLGAAIPDDQDIHDDLIGPEYQIRLDGTTQLEKKEDMKKRGLESPDDGDGLAITFAEDIVLPDEYAAFRGQRADVCEPEPDVFAGVFEEA